MKTRCLVYWLVPALLFGGVVGAQTVTEFAEEYEAKIARQVAEVKTQKQKERMEVHARRAYMVKIQQEQDLLVRSGRLSTPKVEELRVQRKALLDQVEALDKAIAEASREAPEILELQAIAKSNEERIAALQEKLNPEQAPAKDE